MKIGYLSLSLIVFGSLIGCGGGGKDAGTSVFGGGSTGGNTATAAAVTMTLSDSKFNNGDPNATITATTTAVDASGKTLPNIPISFKVVGGNYTQSSSVTDDKGQNVVTIKLGSDKSNRTITVVSSDGTHPVTSYIAVIGSKITSVANPAVVAPGGAGSVTFALKDSNSSPISGQQIEVQGSTGLVAKSGTTDLNGEYVYTFTAPATVGTATLTASAAGVVVTQDVLIQSSSSSIPVVSGSIAASIEVNPSVVSVNPIGLSVNKATVRAKFIDPITNLALKNVRVKFDLNGDVFNVGGSFSVPEVYSDAEGYAITSYIPSSIPSPSGGLTIRACYVGSGPAASACSTAGTASVSKNITVVSSSVSVTVGADEKILTDTDLVYTRRFVVQVVDGSGFAKSNVAITPQLDIIRYYKGSWDIPSGSTAWRRFASNACANEDANRNNFLEPAEDINDSGALEPRRADVAVSFEDTNPNTRGKTDANGRLILRVTYPRNVASWETVSLAITGSVDGSEGRAVWTELLTYPADAVTTITSAPAFVVSPYGEATVDETLPVGTVMPNGKVLSAASLRTPCENPF